MVITSQNSLPMGATPQAPPPLVDTTQILQNQQPQRTAPLEANLQEKPEGIRRRGRRKIPMLRINDDTHRLITFSKRRAGIYKKATEISTLCGVDIGILIFSPAGKAYAYGAPNIESIADRFLRGVNPNAQNDSLSGVLNEAQRRPNVGKLNDMCDELSVYLQSLKGEGDKLKNLKKQILDSKILDSEILDSDCWWDIPVEDLTADQMQKMTTSMEKLKKSSSMRLRDLRAGASSSRGAVQPEDIQMGINEGFGYVDDGGFGDFRKDGSLFAVGLIIGQGFGGSAGGSGGFGDWRDVSSTVAGIQGSGFQQDGNGGLGGLVDWGTSSSFQAGGMQMRGNGVNGYGGAVRFGFGAIKVGGSSSASVLHGGMQIGGYEGGGSGGGDVVGGGIGGDFNAFTAGGSLSESVQQGDVRVGENGGGRFGGGNVADGGIGQRRPIEAPAASLAVQPAVGSMAVGGNIGKRYTGSAGGICGFGDWRAGGLMAAGIQGGGFQLDGNGGLGGLDDWGESSSFQAGGMQMGGNGGSGYSGGAGGYFTAGESLSVSVPQGVTQMCEYGGSEFGGNGQERSVGLSAGWNPVNSSLTFMDIQCSNPMQIVRNGGFGNLGGGGAGGGGDDWRSAGSFAMQMGGVGGFGYKNDVCGSTASGAGGRGGDGGYDDWRSVGSSAIQMGGVGGFGYKNVVGGSTAGGAAGSGGHDDWRSVRSSMMQMVGVGGFGYTNGAGGTTTGGAGGGICGWGAGGASSSWSHQRNPMQMGGNGGLDYEGFGDGAGCEFGGGGGFSDFAAGSSAAAAHYPEDQMGGIGNGGSFYDGGGNGTNNRFGGFLYDGGSKFI